jgi:hypothetical protein
MANLMPAIFFGHGNPMNAIGHNGYTEAWQRIGGTDTAAQGRLVDLGALVCAGNRCDYLDQSTHHS